MSGGWLPFIGETDAGRIVLGWKCKSGAYTVHASQFSKKEEVVKFQEIIYK